MEQNTQALVAQVEALSPERQQALRYLLEAMSVWDEKRGQDPDASIHALVLQRVRNHFLLGWLPPTFERQALPSTRMQARAEVAAALFVEMEMLCPDLALEEAGYGLFAPARQLPMAPPPHACQCRQGAV